MADDHTPTDHPVENTAPVTDASAAAPVTSTPAVNVLEVSGNAVVRLKDADHLSADQQKAALEAVQNYVNGVAATEGILAQSALSSGDNRPDVEFEIVDKATLGSDNEKRYSNALELAAANGNRSAKFVHDNPDLVLLISLVQAFFGNGDQEQAAQQALDIHLQFKDETITLEKGELEQGSGKTPLNDLNNNERLAALTVAKEVLGEDGNALTPEGRSDLLATEIIRQSAERGLTPEQQVSTLQELQGIIKQHGLSDKFDEAKLSAALGQTATDIDIAIAADQKIHGPTREEQIREIAHKPMVEPVVEAAPQVESLMAGSAAETVPTAETMAALQNQEDAALFAAVSEDLADDGLVNNTGESQALYQESGIKEFDDAAKEGAINTIEEHWNLSSEVLSDIRGAFEGTALAGGAQAAAVTGLDEIGVAMTGNNSAAKDQAAGIGA